MKIIKKNIKKAKVNQRIIHGANTRMRYPPTQRALERWSRMGLNEKVKKKKKVEKSVTEAKHKTFGMPVPPSYNECVKFISRLSRQQIKATRCKWKTAAEKKICGTPKL